LFEFEPQNRDFVARPIIQKGGDRREHSGRDQNPDR
jgi:hypothetical protein